MKSESKTKKRKSKKVKVIVQRSKQKTDLSYLRKMTMIEMTISELKTYLRDKYSATRSLPTTEAILRLIDHHDKLSEMVENKVSEKEAKPTRIKRAKR